MYNRRLAWSRNLHHGRIMKTNIFELTPQQNHSHLCSQQLIDYFGITYDLLRDELNSSGGDGSIVVKNRPKDGIFDVSIHAEESKAEQAVHFLFKHGFISSYKLLS